jgi:hypothetical protein
MILLLASGRLLLASGRLLLAARLWLLAARHRSLIQTWLKRISVILGIWISIKQL